MLRNKERNKRYSGFTLIELLVVVAIIGLLTTISVIAFSHMRSQARDARRLADVKQIATALEMYYNDFGAYPDCQACSSRMEGVIDTVPYTEVNPHTGWQNCLGNQLAPYMQKIPTDPINKDGKDYCYYTWYRSAGNMIALRYFLENSNPNLGSAKLWGTNYYGDYMYMLIIQPYGLSCSYGYCQ